MNNIKLVLVVVVVFFSKTRNQYLDSTMKINVISTKETKYFNTQTDQFNQASWADLIILNKEKKELLYCCVDRSHIGWEREYGIREIPGNLPEAEKDTKD